MSESSGWARVEIVRDGKSFGVVGVTVCGRRWEAAILPTRIAARERGQATAEFLGVSLIDATTQAETRGADSGMRSFRWGG